MELFYGWFVDVLMTALAVSALVAFLAVGAARLISPAHRSPATALFMAVFALSLLGFVTGQIMGQSREPAVAAVIPAVLALLGGLIVYVIGSKGVESQTGVSAALASFALAVLVGSLFGIQLRLKSQDDDTNPKIAQFRRLSAAQVQFVIESKRLEYYAYLVRTRMDLES